MIKQFLVKFFFTGQSISFKTIDFNQQCGKVVRWQVQRRKVVGSIPLIPKIFAKFFCFILSCHNWLWNENYAV
ncbi:hypothetical protein B9Z55_001240 [Caenorhabditis nigoni]|uniref:Uncharacterized protein n=1 Tax=Caenorhabditis nigoni TaxID=1611254 RepID=A0A2G5VF15_9PELO|nr:hypothetical protein B9Z55_001240 [Caenorhabditis nigoni]